MTLRKLVFDLGFSSQIGSPVAALPLLFQVGEHALVAHFLEIPSAGAGGGDLTFHYPDPNPTDAFGSVSGYQELGIRTQY